MNKREILIDRDILKTVKRSDVCEMVLKSGYFLTNGEVLYKINLDLCQWDAIAKKNEAVEIRSIFSDEWQPELEDYFTHTKYMRSKGSIFLRTSLT